MGSLTWNGSSGEWSDASNWSVLSGLDQTPGAGDAVTINAPGSYLVIVTGTQSIENLTLNAPGATVALKGTPSAVGGGTLAVNGALTGGGGTLDLTQGG